MSWMKPICENVVSPAFTILWVAVIVVFGLVTFGLLIRAYLKVRRDLQAGINIVGQVADESRFCAQYEATNRALKQVPLLQHPWREFTENLIFPSQEDAQKLIKNTRDPSAYFNVGAVIDPALHLRFLGAVPNLLMGLGILGTFVGLAAGIFLGQGAIAVADQSAVAYVDKADALVKQLGGLLDGASLAFVTSIAGISCSLLFQIAERPVLRGLSRRRSKFTDFVDAGLRRVTSEQLAAEQLKQQQQQTQLLRRFNTDLAVSLAEALDDRISKRLTPTFEKLIEAVEGVRADRNQANHETLREVVDEFKSAISGAAGTELKSMADSLNQVNEALKSSIDSVSAKVESAGTSAADAMNRAAASFESGVAGLTEATDNAGNVLNSLSGSLGQLQHLTLVIGQAYDQFKNTVEPIEVAASVLGECSQQAREALAQTASLAAQLKETSEQKRLLQESLTKAWDDYRQRFESVDQALANAFRQMVEGLEAYTARVREFSSDMDKHMGKGMQDLGGAIAELSGVVEELPRRMAGPAA